MVLVAKEIRTLFGVQGMVKRWGLWKGEVATARRIYVPKSPQPHPGRLQIFNPRIWGQLLAEAGGHSGITSSTGGGGDDGGCGMLEVETGVGSRCVRTS